MPNTRTIVTPGLLLLLLLGGCPEIKVPGGGDQCKPRCIGEQPIGCSPSGEEILGAACIPGTVCSQGVCLPVSADVTPTDTTGPPDVSPDTVTPPDASADALADTAVDAAPDTAVDAGSDTAPPDDAPLGDLLADADAVGPGDALAEVDAPGGDAGTDTAPDVIAPVGPPPCADDPAACFDVALCDTSDEPAIPFGLGVGLVCAQQPSCCLSSWDQGCVDLLKQNTYYFSCECAEGLACSGDADCDGCPSQTNLTCAGPWTCQQGLCAPTAPPAEQACYGNSPCEASDLGGSDDAEVTACVVMLNLSCSYRWGHDCVWLAVTECGATCAGCAGEGQACDGDLDCLTCDIDANRCNGSYACSGGTCQPVEPVTCDNEGLECGGRGCDPWSGECSPGFGPSLGYCDDGDPTTLDSCVHETNMCQYKTLEEVVVGGTTSPCMTGGEGAGGSSDDAIDLCVCSQDPYCCTGYWHEYCVYLATDACGASCECAGLPAAELACTSDADCVGCNVMNGQDSCALGAWTCGDAGICEQGAPEDCSALSVGCAQAYCGGGACQVDLWHHMCEDGDACTVDVCQADGTCSSEAVDSCLSQDPCVARPTGGAADDPVIEACVCDWDPWCCSGSWHGGCVSKAVECGASCCPATCETHVDCTHCDANGACDGVHGCVDGTCQLVSAPKTCDPADDVGCLKSTCVGQVQPLCQLVPDTSSCVDGDICTVDYCDAGTCGNFPITDASCGTNGPCEAAETPGSSDPQITACVCAQSPYCCGSYDPSWGEVQGGWESWCVELAVTQCGADCNYCFGYGQVDVSCDVDSDCQWCPKNQDPCTYGAFTCEGNVCTQQPPVVCDTSGDIGCAQTQCVWPGTCQEVLDTSGCDDGDVCTQEVCDPQTGVCSSNPLDASCGTNSPCESALTPGSNDQQVTTCVCYGHGASECCTQEWGPWCTFIAASWCGSECPNYCFGSSQVDLPCVDDEECAYCAKDQNPCTYGAFTCEGGVCTQQPPVVCDTSGDIGCAKTQCAWPGTCQQVLDTSGCDDGDVCTQEVCDPQTGECSSNPLDASCGTNSPCEPALTPGSNDASVTDCVCNSVGATWCCEDAWDSYCVDYAAECGVVCE